MHLLQTNPRIWIDYRRHVHPIGPGLRHKRVRLELVEKILTLLVESLHLLRRDGGGERLVGGIELLMQLVGFCPKRREFRFCALIFSECLDGLGDFVGVDLRREIGPHNYRFSLQFGRNLLIQHHDNAGRICPDVVLCDVHIFHFGDAFQIGGDLFERVSFRGFDRQPYGICPGVVITHSVFPAGCHHPDVGRGRALR